MKQERKTTGNGSSLSRRQFIGVAGASCAGLVLGRRALGAEENAAPAATGAEDVVRQVIVNDDGFSQFHSGQYRTADDLRKFVRQFAGTDVTAIEWCLGTGGAFNFDTKVGDVLGAGITEEVYAKVRRGDRLVCETVQRLVAEGNEPLRVVADEARAQRIPCFASLRVDAFYDDTFAELVNGSFWRNHRDQHLVLEPGRKLDRFCGPGLSYFFPEVRQFYLDLLTEAVQRDVAGVNLDFERRPPYFGVEKPLVDGFRAKHGYEPPGEKPEAWWRYRAGFMTEFVRALRVRLNEAGTRLGHPLKLTAKIGGGSGYTAGSHLRHGLDVPTWVSEGLVDQLILFQSPRQVAFDLQPFLQWTKGSHCAIICGTDAVMAGHDLSPEEDRALARGEKLKMESRGMVTREYCERARAWYRAGADGFHLFNGWGGPETLRVLGTLRKVETYLAEHKAEKTP
jgi:hypothetical protein